MALAIPRVVAFDLSIPAQIFGHIDQRERYSFAVAARRPGMVETTTGFAIQAQHGISELTRADTVVVPGFADRGDLDIEVLDALRRAHERGARMVSVCTGAFALAAAGVLDGRRATTHWRNAEELQERYSSIDVDPAVLYVEQGTVATSAGIAAGIDLCLQLVRRDAGSAAAAAIARRMVVAPHRTGGQAQYIEHAMPEVSTFASVCDWATTNLDATITVDQLARRAGWSPRTFSRRFTAETGTSPHRWLTIQRLALARELLERTDLTVDDIATRAGFGSGSNLRTHFHRDTGVTPSAYRQTFAAVVDQKDGFSPRK